MYHWHFRPRYQPAFHLAGLEFTDKEFSKPYPQNTNRLVGPGVMEKIIVSYKKT